jgi:hypothetical protein
VETQLEGRRDVARLLLDLRREIEAGRRVEVEEARALFAHVLNVEDGIEPDGEPTSSHAGPAGGATSPV